MYPQLFSAAGEVDQAFLIIFAFAILVLVVVTVLMLVFVWRYNHKRHPTPKDIRGNIWLEIIWTVLPTAIVLGMFWTGWTSFKAMRTIPDDAMAIEVEGRMWSWKFTYPNGRTANELVVPINTPIKLIMTSRDVIHSFYVPALRLKWDTVPGMVTDAWFESNATGEFDIFCAEYCGLKHADMITLLKVVEQDEYDNWLDEADNRALGAKLTEEYGCLDCHSLDGSEGAGPTFLGVGGRELAVTLPDGGRKSVMADAAYLRKAILDPSSEIVDGWDDMMPPYEGVIPEEEVNAIVTYLQSLTAEKPASPGEILAKDQGCVDCHSIDGSEGMGPTLLGLYGKKQIVTRDGAVMEVTVDDRYLHEAIIAPGKAIPDGQDDMMPSYDSLSKEEVDSLVDWIKSLEPPSGE